MLRKLDDIAARLEIAVTLFLLSVIVVVVVVQVICRYLLQDPLSWSEEVARSSLIWISFIGGAFALREKAHFAVELLASKLPQPMRALWEILLIAVVAVFLIVILYQSVLILPVVHYQRSPSLEIPMSYLYLAIPVGSGLMLVHIASAIVEKVSETRTRLAR